MAYDMSEYNEISSVKTSNNEVFNFADTSLRETVSQLSSSSSTITIDGDVSDLSIANVTIGEYKQILSTRTILSNELYVIRNEGYVDAYGEQIKHVAPGIELSDAVNVEQLSAATIEIAIPTLETSSGKAADAKAVAIALWTGYTEWEFKGELEDNVTYTIDENLDLYGNDQPIEPRSYAWPNDENPLSIWYCSNVDISAFRHLVTPTNISQLSNDSGFISEIPDSYALKSDIKISYHQTEQKIVLSSGTNITSVDCSDFIKDGMLSSVELCGTQLILKFNTEADSQPISVELSNFVDDYNSTIEEISNKIDNKIIIDDRISGIVDQSDLSVIKLSASEYEQLVYDDGTLSNALYIVEDDYVNAYGEQIKNVAYPTDLSDAATKEYVDNSLLNVQIPTDLSAFTNSPGYLVSNDISDYCYFKNETSSAIEINTAFELSSGNKVFIDDRISGICQQIDLSIIHLSSSEYEELSTNNQLLSNALYIVEDSFTNNYDKQIKNLAPGTDLSDAVNLEQLNNIISTIEIPTDLSSFTNSPQYVLSNEMTAYYAKSETSSAQQINNALQDFSTIFIDDQLLSVCKQTDLSIVKLSSSEYEQLVYNDQTLSDVLYIVENNNIDAYGSQIKNISPGTDLSDAATIGQIITNINTSLSTILANKTYDMNQNGILTTMVIDLVEAFGGTIVNRPSTI